MRHHPAVLGVALIVIISLASCSSGDTRADDSPESTESAPVTEPQPPAQPPPLPAASVPLVPDSLLVRRGACPFECCVYGDWVARSVMPVFEGETERSDTVFVLQPGDSFTAETGNVHITSLARVVVRREVREFSSLDAGQTFVPGDTLLLLDYLGEGFFNVWVDDELYQPEQFWVDQAAWAEDSSASGYVVGMRETEWWIRVGTTDGRGGWMEATAGDAFDGADACG